ncbi:unnamed protein product, partial [Prorocentrum cordatum]
MAEAREEPPDAAIEELPLERGSQTPPGAALGEVQPDAAVRSEQPDAVGERPQHSPTESADEDMPTEPASQPQVDAHLAMMAMPVGATQPTGDDDRSAATETPDSVQVKAEDGDCIGLWRMETDSVHPSEMSLAADRLVQKVCEVLPPVSDDEETPVPDAGDRGTLPLVLTETPAPPSPETPFLALPRAPTRTPLHAASRAPRPSAAPQRVPAGGVEPPFARSSTASRPAPSRAQQRRPLIAPSSSPDASASLAEGPPAYASAEPPADSVERPQQSSAAGPAEQLPTPGGPAEARGPVAPAPSGGGLVQ